MGWNSGLGTLTTYDPLTGKVEILSKPTARAKPLHGTTCVVYDAAGNIFMSVRQDSSRSMQEDTTGVLYVAQGQNSRRVKLFGTNQRDVQEMELTANCLYALSRAPMLYVPGPFEPVFV